MLLARQGAERIQEQGIKAQISLNTTEENKDR